MPESPQQGELLPEAPPLPEGAPLLSARKVNEYVYCPRLANLELVQGEWKENADTVAGAHTHRRVDHSEWLISRGSQAKTVRRLYRPNQAIGESPRRRARSPIPLDEE